MPPAGHELDAAARIAAADIVGEVVATAPARASQGRAGTKKRCAQALNLFRHALFGLASTPSDDSASAALDNMTRHLVAGPPVLISSRLDAHGSPRGRFPRFRRRPE